MRARTLWIARTTGALAVIALAGALLPSTSQAAAPACEPSLNLFGNPGFETGSLAPWSVLGTNPPPSISTAQAHSGTHSVVLGTITGPEPNGDGSLYQQIAVPASPSLLSFWYWPSTTDTVSFDWQEVDITDTSGTVLATVFHQAVNSQVWTNTTYDMSAFAGQTVRVLFKVHQDGFGDDTAMYVDDVCLSPTPRTLTVAKAGSGAGTVSSAPAGINCGATCSAKYGDGTSVTLTATPAAGSRFAGWSGAGCSGTNACTVAMHADHAVTASFVAQHGLSVAKTGSGAGTVFSSPPGISCGTTCSAKFDSGTGVTLTAVSAAGSRFAGWSGGGCSGTGPCTVTMNADSAVSAAFVTPPDTGIRKAKINQKAKTATFKFKARGSATGFQCALQKTRPGKGFGRPHFKRCRSPKTYRHLSPGKYRFDVRAVGFAGRDPSPAKKTFVIR
jgi:hypothetical protein